SRVPRRAAGQCGTAVDARALKRPAAGAGGRPRVISKRILNAVLAQLLGLAFNIAASELAASRSSRHRHRHGERGHRPAGRTAWPRGGAAKLMPKRRSQPLAKTARTPTPAARPAAPVARRAPPT